VASLEHGKTGDGRLRPTVLVCSRAGEAIPTCPRRRVVERHINVIVTGKPRACPKNGIMPSSVGRQVPRSFGSAGDGRGFDRLLVKARTGLARFPATNRGERIVAASGLHFVEPGERLEAPIDGIAAIKSFADSEHRIGETAVGVVETRLRPRLGSFLEARRGRLKKGGRLLILRTYPP
jgi:hypothetical protein